MALFFELPVYKLGYDLVIEIYQRTAVFSREYKYTMGERLKNETTDPQQQQWFAQQCWFQRQLLVKYGFRD